MTYCILRTEKLKTFGNISGSGEHNFRERETHNADQNCTPLNKTTGAQNTSDLLNGIKARLCTVTKVRKNAVLVLEYFIGASPEWFKTTSEKQRESYFDDAENWLKTRHGAENVIAVTRQYDETSPHICAYVVPIDPKGKLNCSYFQDGRDKLQAMQTEYAVKIGAKHGLERGIEGSTAKHQSIKSFYAAVNAPTPTVKTKIPDVPDATLSESFKESMGVSTAHSAAVAAAELDKKKRAVEIKAQREVEQAKAKQFDVLTRENKGQSAALAQLRATSVQVRQIDLKEVLERFGSLPDPSDKNNWRTPVGRITVTGAKFFNHDTSNGGGGAIDLAMHLDDCDYKTAVQRLAAEFGTGAVVSQAIITVKAEIEAAAAAPMPPFVAPAPVPENWHVVRDYLHHVRKISVDVVEGLKKAGKLYADKFRNCVFVLRSGAGVELRGTGDKPYHGIRGKKTGFIIRRGSSEVRNVAFVESSIDAISLYELEKFEGEIIATGGNAVLMVKTLADKYRRDGYQVYAAFDNDKSGDAQALTLGQVQRLRPVLKDWNADLVASKAPQPKRQVQRQAQYLRMRPS